MTRRSRDAHQTRRAKSSRAPVRRPAAQGSDESLLRDTLAAAAAELGVRLAGEALDLLALHYRELMRWRRRADLTSLADARAIAIRHFADSLSLVPRVPRGLRVVDLGSGAGFPGIPLAVARPDLDVTLLESREVKLAFLHHVVQLLGRANLHVERAAYPRPDSQAAASTARFDAVVVRAVAGVASTLQLASDLVAPGGRVFLMRGPSRAGEEDIQSLPEWGVTAEHRLTLPIESCERRIVELVRAKTPCFT